VKRNGGDGRIFSMRWIESGGPKIAAPKTFGFGRTAIEQSLAKAIDGTVSLDFLPTGLTCTIRAPANGAPRHA
jgi:two-component sensor histidine kinase